MTPRVTIMSLPLSFLGSYPWAFLCLFRSSAQGGDAVYRSLRLQIPLAREYMEPNGLQDAASDLRTTSFSTMSSTYVTLLSAAVTVGEVGDAVLVQVRAGFKHW